MEIIHGYERVTEWKHYTGASVAMARKDGKMFTIRKYRTPVMPPNNGALEEKTYNLSLEKFQTFVNHKSSFNQLLRKAAEYGKLVVAVEEFVEGCYYMEVWEIIDGVVPNADVEGTIARLTFQEKRFLMVTMASALGYLHMLGLVHGNLTLESFLLIKMIGGLYSTKLARFEDCYHKENPPECLLGDIRYFAPEVMVYNNEEGDKERLKHTLTRKADIFSLGLVFHYFLTGEFPEAIGLTERLQQRKAEGKPVYCWSVLLNGGDLKVRDDIPTRYKLIIEDMLRKDPLKRPDALGVMTLLKFEDVGGTKNS